MLGSGTRAARRSWREGARLRKRVTAVFCAAAFVLIGACGSQKPVTPPSTGGHRTIAEGYSLVYQIASQQKGLKNLLLVKLESDAIDRVISDIADYTGTLCTQLEDMASRYPALTIERQFLPEVEVKARESIASATTKTFLTSGGAEFERDLLLSQRSALEQEQHLAKVMVEIETADERRAFWRQVEDRFSQLRGDVDGVLREHFFCHGSRAGDSAKDDSD